MFVLVVLRENYFVRRSDEGFSSRPTFLERQVNLYNRSKSGWWEYGVCLAREVSIKQNI